MEEKPKSKINLNRVDMPRQDPKVRAHNYNEVALGYNDEMVKAEASRCIQCPKRGCVSGCPVNVDIPEFIKAVREDNMVEAVRILKSKNALPAICGRVCPQETQCEQVCTLGKKGAPIAIGRIERYVADWERTHKDELEAADAPPKPTGKRVAVVGSGPAEQELKTLARRLGVEPQVTWLGDVGEDELNREYRSAGVLVLLSAAEAYGLAVAEALSCGTPAVVAKKEALVEFLDEPGCVGVDYPPRAEEVFPGNYYGRSSLSFF